MSADLAQLLNRAAHELSTDGPLDAARATGLRRVVRRRRARRHAVESAVGVAAVGLVGSAAWLGAGRFAPAPPALGPSPSVSATPTPSRTAVESQAPSPTAVVPPPVATTSPPPASPAGITSAGIGPVRLGMTFSEASSAVGASLPDNGACAATNFTSAVTGIDDLWLTSAQGAPGVVDGVYAFSYGHADPATGPRTAAGVGLGSTAAELVAAYPDATVVDGSTYVITLDGVPLAFQVDDSTGTVTYLGVGTASLPMDFCG